MTGPDRRVTVGVPVRNGAATLRDAVRSVLNQTHRQLEVVICDNASTDDTAAICEEIRRDDPRVRYLRQPEAVPVMDNWATAWRQATTPYFMWAAADDLRSPDFVERLLAALDARPDAGGAFGEVIKFRRSPAEDGYRHEYCCDTAGVGTTKRLFMDKNGPFAPYGLYRTEVFDGYRWYGHTISPDWPLFIHVLVRTEIVQVPGPIFYYREPDRPLSLDARAMAQSYQQPETHLTVRLSWRCALAARDAASARGRRRLVPVDFVVLLAGLLWVNRSRVAGRLLRLGRRPNGGEG